MIVDTREAVKRIEGKVDTLAEALPGVRERVSVLETRMGAEERRA